MHELDDPVWSSLSDRHQLWAIGDSYVRRYRPEIAPFIALRGPCSTPASLIGKDEEVVVVGEGAHFLDPACVCIHASNVHQMIYQGSGDVVETDPRIVALDASHAGDMLGLTALAFPGYYRSETYRFGAYFGIFERKELVAMAGARMHLGSYREISAICTHPDYRHRGYARLLTRRVMQKILEDGEHPFLHVGDANAPAIALYESLGFRWRLTLPVLRFRLRDGGP